MDVDVFIAGAGPAGCATALSLARFTPELRVALADAPPRETLRVGEAVPPPIRPILEHLGLWQTFSADGHCPSYRTLSAWGSARLGSNEFLLHPHHAGWRLDRARFDSMLRRAAVPCAAFPIAARVSGLVRIDGRWRIVCGDGNAHTARVVVDATGRAAALARLVGLRPAGRDGLVGCFVHFEGTGGEPELTLETFSDGWWYTAALPGGRRVVACMSDADAVRRLGLGRLDGFARALAATRHLSAWTAAPSRPLGPPRLRPAGSQILAADAAPQSLISVGDAASCFDPISAQGIVKALRSGILASYAIADWLRRGDPAGIKRHRSLAQVEFDAYRDTLREYYALEQRWPDRPFWRRRGAREDAGLVHPPRVAAALSA